MRPADMPPPEKFKHGTRARYVGCRCDACRAANAANAAARVARSRELAKELGGVTVSGALCSGVDGKPCAKNTKLRSSSTGGICGECREYLVWNGLVDTARARRHLRRLSARGIGRRAVSAACDVAQELLQGISNGRRQKIRRNTERRILAVDVGARADASLVPAGPTWKLIDALIARGFTRGEIARRLGAKRPSLQLGTVRILARTAADVARLYRTVGMPDDSKGLAAADLVPCARCGLRGHVAGDAERCLVGAADAGMGQSAWMGEGR